MRDLSKRLAALDPSAADAVQVIAYFDRLTEGRAGLEAVVRGAAVLSGCPARLVDGGRVVRVEPDGRRRDDAGPVDEAWPGAPLAPGGPTSVWLERRGLSGEVDAMVLERLAVAVRVVLDRAPGRAPDRDDRTAVEALFDRSAPERERLRAARRLGLAGVPLARAVALPGGKARVEAVSGSPMPGNGTRPPVDGHDGRSQVNGLGARPPTDGHDGRPPVDGPAGVGPAVPVLELPRSWADARLAFRLTAEGTEQDPGPRVVHADQLGGLAVLSAAVGPDSEIPPDVHTLERAGSAARWMLVTLQAVASSASLRAAAAVLNVHHSTLQERIIQAEHLLGWPVRDPQGRLRLQLAFALRRLHRHRHDLP